MANPIYLLPAYFILVNVMCSKVDSAYVLDIDDADIALLPKGDNVNGNG